MGRRRRVHRAAAPYRRRLRLEPLEDRRLLALYLVSSLDDAGAGSLREAIALANAAEGPDTIEFAEELSGGTISLGAGQMQITEALVIDARPLAANVTIDANELSRIFNITATTGDFTLGGLTLTGGRTTVNSSNGFGGAIRSLTLGNLTLDQSTVSGSSTAGSFAYGGGVFAKGTVTLTQSRVSGNSTAGPDARGGGIMTYGAVTLTQSTVSGNSTGGTNAYGGGIRAGGAMTLTESTVNGNSTAGSNAKGGGIWTYNAVTLTQSTLSGNSTTGYLAHGGGIFSSGAVTLTQSTVTENHALDAAANPAMGGGVYQLNTFSNHPFTISGSIVAGNTAGGSGADLVKDPQSALTVNYSLIGTGITPTAGGNNVVTNAPQLGPLANNGGPTQTHAPLFGSPAIDAGDESIDFNPAEFDQRGAPFVRVFDGDGTGAARIDIGAYELQIVPSLHLVVDTTADEDDGDYSAGNLSLREAIGLANASFGPDTITFAAALSGATITLGGTELEIEEALVIDARPLAANVTIDANELSRIFNITATTGDFTLGGLTLTGGRTTAADSTGSGGAIHSLTTGNLIVDQSTVSGNSTTGIFAAESGADGGGIFAVGSVTLIQSTVSGNSTAANLARGGGVFSSDAITLTQSTISGNSSNFRGGGIAARGAVTLTQSTVSGNSSFFRGGGIWAYGAVTLTQSTVTENHAVDPNFGSNEAMGGGVFQANTAYNHPFSISGSIVAGNTADSGADLEPDLQSTLSVNYSLIGTDPLLIAGGNNVFTDNPQLGPLANNGGPTETHALLAGSPAIEAGDPGFMGPPDFDQRGEPFARVFDGDGADGAQIDMGAVEFIPNDAVHAIFGDYNRDGRVDAGDYVRWRNTLGTGGLDPYEGADGSGDGMVGPEDYPVWKAHYGEDVPTSPGGGGLSAALSEDAETRRQGDKEIVFVEPNVVTSLSRGPTVRGAAADLRTSALPRPAAGATDAALLAWFTARGEWDGESVDELAEAWGGESDDGTQSSRFDGLDAAFAVVGDGA